MFRRLTSKRYFEDVKEIFDVETIEDFKTNLTSTHDSYLGQDQMKLNNSFEYVHPIKYYMNLNEIGYENRLLIQIK